MNENCNELSPEQRLYAELRSEGCWSPTYCAQKVFPHLKKRTAQIKGFAFEKDPQVQAYIKHLCEQTETSLTLSRQEKREFLARVVRTPIGEINQHSDLCDQFEEFFDNEGNLTKTRLKMPSKTQCIEIDNRMAGHNEPEKLDITSGGGVMVIPGGATLDQWEKQAASQQAKLKEAAEEDLGED